MTLADQIRETAIRVPRQQARTLWAIAYDIDRLERAIDEIVGDAQADAMALAHAKAQGHG